jgi:hypothetical protein
MLALETRVHLLLGLLPSDNTGAGMRRLGLASRQFNRFGRGLLKVEVAAVQRAA